MSAPTLNHITTIDYPCISGIVLQACLGDGDGPMTNSNDGEGVGKRLILLQKARGGIDWPRVSQSGKQPE